jgi:hypothetical protein
VLADYELTSKVLSVTLDNTSANASAMDELTPSLSSYVGSSLLHQRCACHIINLIVKSGLKRLDHIRIILEQPFPFLILLTSALLLLNHIAWLLGFVPISLVWT